jgi:probable HAF family extracellular repeat protein
MVCPPWAADNEDTMKVLSVFLAAAFGGAVAFSGTILTIQDLGTLGGTNVAAAGINRFGQVAGYGTDANGVLHAFAGLGTAGDISAPWGNGSSARTLNDLGAVAGNVFVGGSSQAVVWTNGVAQPIGGLGGPDSYATGINNNQQVTGMATDSAGAGRAVVYSGGTVQDLGVQGYWSSGYGINDMGVVAGYALDSSFHFQAFTWDPNQGVTWLGGLTNGGSYAFSINNFGEIAGHSAAADGYYHAVVWDESGLTDLGTLNGGSSFAYSINANGQVVGYAEVEGGGTHAFLYSGGVLFDLNSLVSNLTGWELTKAFGINDNGQIVGTGVLNGVEHAFRLDPALTTSYRGAAVAPALDLLSTPEPGTNLLIAGGLLALALIGYRKRKSIPE